MRTAIATISALLLLVPGQLLAASRVTQVGLSSEEGQTVARIGIDGTVRFNHQTVGATDGKSFRIIIDVLSAVHALPQKNFSELPDCPVQQIRTSQFAVTPEEVVRLVFDMDAETAYRVTSDEHSIRVFLPDRQKRNFAGWSSATAGPVSTPVESSSKAVVTASASKPKTEKSATVLNEAVQDDRLASLSDEPKQPSTGTAPATKETKESTKKKTSAKQEQVPSTPMVKMNIPYGPDFIPMQPKPSEPEKSDVKSPEKPEVAASPTPTVSKASKAKQESGGQKDRPAMAKAPTTGEPPAAAKPSAKVEPTKKQTLASEGPYMGPIPLKPPAEAGAPADKEPAGTRKKVSPKPNVKKAGAKPTLAATDEQPTAKKSTTPPGKKTSPVSDTVTEEGKAKQIPPTMEEDETTPGTDEKPSTSRFRRSPTRPTKIAGTLVAEFPKRLVIKYVERGQRDPFATLIDETKKYNDPIKGRVPNVEVIKLVGILQSETGFRSALFEDKDGYGYILREGDKVENGYVLRVTSDRVFFQIFEYGWSRTVALNID